MNLCIHLASTVRYAGRAALKNRSIFATGPRMLQRRDLSSEADEVLAQNVGDKGVVILNRPKALNAVNLNMVTRMHDILTQWEKEKTLVVAKGAGDKAFCAGGDVKTITLACARGEDYGKQLFRREYMTNYVISTYAIPYIALIDGFTIGGGLGMSIHGQYRVATEKTLCAMPETAIGLFPDIGASYFLSRLKGKLGLYLALSGYRLKGVDNMFVGFATHYCSSADIPRVEKDLLASNNPKEVLRPYEKLPQGAKFSLEPHLSKIDDIFSAPTMEEIFRRLEKDGSDWSNETLATLKKFSPLSLKITMKELQLGSQLSLKECFQMEYRLASRSCDGYNFIEGVRALLVDKDLSPKWKPATIEEVSQKMVDEFFAPLKPEEELALRNVPRSSL